MVVFSGLLIFNFLLFPFYFLYKWYKCLWDYLMSLILSFCSKIFRFFLCFVGLWRPRGFRFVDLLLCSILFFSLMFVFCLCQLHIFESWSQRLLFPVLFWYPVVTRVLCLVLLPLSHPLSLVSAVLTCFLSPHYLLCIIVLVSPCPFVVVLEELLFWIICGWSVVIFYLMKTCH